MNMRSRVKFIGGENMLINDLHLSRNPDGTYSLTIEYDNGMKCGNSSLIVYDVFIDAKERAPLEKLRNLSIKYNWSDFNK